MRTRIIAGCVLALVAALCVRASAETAQEERNKQIAIEFYNAALNEKNWEKAATYIGNRYTQHSLYMQDGPGGLEGLVARIKKEYPENRGEIQRAIADGDLVMLHLHVTRHRQHRGWSVIEVMRLENEKVVEHWDMFRTVPEEGGHELF